MDKQGGIDNKTTLSWIASVFLLFLLVGTPLYFWRQAEAVKEKARLALETKCLGYEEELSTLTKRFFRLGANGRSMEEQSGRGSLQFSILLPSINSNLDAMKEVSDRTSKIKESYKQECGENRSKDWFSKNFERLKLEGDPQSY